MRKIALLETLPYRRRLIRGRVGPRTSFAEPPLRLRFVCDLYFAGWSAREKRCIVVVGQSIANAVHRGFVLDRLWGRTVRFPCPSWVAQVRSASASCPNNTTKK